MTDKRPYSVSCQETDYATSGHPVGVCHPIPPRIAKAFKSAARAGFRGVELFTDAAVLADWESVAAMARGYSFDLARGPERLQANKGSNVSSFGRQKSNACSSGRRANLGRGRQENRSIWTILGCTANLSSESSRPIVGLILGGIAVLVCYYFVDRPVAWFVHNHRLCSDDVLLWPSLVSDWLACLMVLGMVVVAMSRWWRPASSRRTLFLAITSNLVLTAGIKSVLKWAFGRPVPAAWIHDGVYGFHPFDSRGSLLSFPSGHAAATLAVISILWVSRPRWRSLYMIVGGLICVALVALNYHFVGDVIAGAMLGSVTGAYATRIFRLRPPETGQDQSGSAVANVGKSISE